MIRALLSLSPAVLGTVAAIAGSGLSLGAAKLWNDWIDNPAIVREQQAVCVSKVEAAAAKATRDEQLRQFRAGEAATEQFIIRSHQAADDQAARDTLFELELKAHEDRMAKSGKVQCSLDSDDLSILGLRVEPSPATGRQ